jgi:hypothetical protein
MGESTVLFGENVKKRSASKKIFELTMASPTDFFTHSSLLYILSKVKVFTWWSNIIAYFFSLVIILDRSGIKSAEVCYNFAK